MLTVPGSSKGAFSSDCPPNGRVRRFHSRRDDVDTVLVLEGRVGPLPGCDAAAAVAQEDLGGLHPCGAEAVEEVGLSGDDVLVEVCVAELADVDLRLVRFDSSGM